MRVSNFISRREELAKKQETKPTKKQETKPTKGQISHWQKEQRREILVRIVGLAVAVVALALIGAGVYYQWYLGSYKPLHETAIEVNGKKFSVSYYLDALDYYMAGQTPYVYYFIDPVAEQIIQGELIRQEAAELGFNVSEDEVRKVIKEQGLDDNQAMRDIVATQLIVDKLRQEHFGPQIPASAEQREVSVIFLESESQAQLVKERLEAGEEFSDLVEALSLDPTSKEEGGNLGWHPRGILGRKMGTSLAIDDIVFNLPPDSISDPVEDAEKTKKLGYWLIKVVERSEGELEAHVQAMLLSSEEEALMVREELEGGGDFLALADEHSQWQTSGESKGDLGWISQGDMSSAFESYALSQQAELGTVSQPVKDEDATTKGGYWLIKASASQEKEISEEDRGTLIDNLFSDWLEEVRSGSENTVQNYLDAEKKDFIIQRVLG